MGQYYRPLIIDGSEVIIYNRKVDGEIELAKLMEHSWLLNEIVGKVFGYLYKNPCRVAWVGDYYDGNVPNTPLTGTDVWMNSASDFISESMIPDNQYLINHDAHLYIRMDEYISECTSNGWCVHPLPILTACGNGRGGGDYSGVNEHFVGSWAGALISVEDDKPEGYQELNVSFAEKLA